MSFREPRKSGTAKASERRFVGQNDTLAFAPGETTKTITIEVKGDSKKQAKKTACLDLFGNRSNSWLTRL
jgi:hypothetical protein